MTGKDLTNIRLDLGLSQTELAKRLGVSTQHYQTLEQNKKNKIPLLYALALATVENQRREELSPDELQRRAASVRRRYEAIRNSRKKTLGKKSTNKKPKSGT